MSNHTPEEDETERPGSPLSCPKCKRDVAVSHGNNGSSFQMYCPACQAEWDIGENLAARARWGLANTGLVCRACRRPCAVLDVTGKTPARHCPACGHRWPEDAPVFER